MVLFWSQSEVEYQKAKGVTVLLVVAKDLCVDEKVFIAKRTLKNKEGLFMVLKVFL